MRFVVGRSMARVASPRCSLCGGRKMRRIYVKKSNQYVGMGWVCKCDAESVYTELESKGWALV